MEASAGLPAKGTIVTDLILAPWKYADPHRETKLTAPQRQLLNPHMDAEAWWNMARRYPRAAMGSPLFDVLTLENPERWIQMSRSAWWDWIAHHVEQLNEYRAAAFGLACAVHAMAAFEPSPLLDVIRPTLLVLHRILDRGEHRFDSERSRKELTPLRHLIIAERVRLLDLSKVSVRRNIGPLLATEAALWLDQPWTASEEARETFSDSNERRVEEALWQWNHLQGYLKKG